MSLFIYHLVCFLYKILPTHYVYIYEVVNEVYRLVNCCYCLLVTYIITIIDKERREKRKAYTRKSGANRGKIRECGKNGRDNGRTSVDMKLCHIFTCETVWTFHCL